MTKIRGGFVAQVGSETRCPLPQKQLCHSRQRHRRTAPAFVEGSMYGAGRHGPAQSNYCLMQSSGQTCIDSQRLQPLPSGRTTVRARK
jgi:hypothetical protein